MFSLIEEQVYATWKSYQFVTNKETRKEGLISTGNAWILMSSPADADTHNTASIYQSLSGELNNTQGIKNFGGWTYYTYSARPALYG